MDQTKINEYKQRINKVKEPNTAEDWEEFNRLQPIISTINTLESLKTQLSQANEMIENETDSDLKKLAQEDSKNIQTQLVQKEEELKELIKEESYRPDPNDVKSAIMEIRAGAGGDESSLFASDLFRMYSNYAKTKKYEVLILSQHLTATGGIKEIIIKIDGKNAFGTFKWESGVHRVQRIPTTEASGRIHTSTASVAVLPEVKDVEIEIKPEDLRIDTFRSSGAGGQCVNKTESAVRLTHIPTNIIVSCQDSKSQLQNREMAMTVLRSRIYELEEQKKQAEQGSMRQKQIGNAMRAEKVRTYNYPQSRITDHRIKKSWHNLEGILNGNLDEIIESFKDYGR